MKNLIEKKIAYFLVLISLVLMTGCGLKKTALTEENKVYAGQWVAADGTWIHIYLNGGGDLKDGGTSVTGGKTTIEDEVITIGMMGIGKDYKIDKSPYNDDGEWKMELDGNIYVKR